MVGESMFYVQFLYSGAWHAHSWEDQSESLSYEYEDAISRAFTIYRLHGCHTQVIDIDGEVYAEYGEPKVPELFDCFA